MGDLKNHIVGVIHELPLRQMPDLLDFQDSYEL